VDSWAVPVASVNAAPAATREIEKNREANDGDEVVTAGDLWLYLINSDSKQGDR
jgi:hypothetical protein